MTRENLRNEIDSLIAVEQAVAAIDRAIESLDKSLWNPSVKEKTVAILNSAIENILSTH